MPDRLTIIKIREELSQTEYLLGAYSHVPFTIPSAWNDYLINKDQQYYTFEIGINTDNLDDRQSSIIGGNSPTYLKMNANSEDLSQCRVIALSEKKLNFLEGIEISLLTGPTSLTILDLEESHSSCFSSNQPTGDYMTWLKNAIGLSLDSIQYSLVDFYTY